jgi:hypothetical protein
MGNAFKHQARAGHLPQHAAAKDERAGFTYGDPGPSGIRDVAYGDQGSYVTVPFTTLMGRDDAVGDLFHMDNLLRDLAEGNSGSAVVIPSGMEDLITQPVGQQVKPSPAPRDAVPV